MKEIFDCRSALFMPAVNDKAMHKGPVLPADAIIVDLEDSVAPSAKNEARNAAVNALSGQDYGYRLRALRINDVNSEWYGADVDAAASAKPDVIVLPKVDSEQDIAQLSNSMDEAGFTGDTRIWAMMESPLAVVEAQSIASCRSIYPRLACLLIGNNDMARAANMPVQSDRTYLIPWLMTLIAAAKSQGLGVLDGVYNDFADLQGFTAECEQARMMGMDGKLLIHPQQLLPANKEFSPSPAVLAEAQIIVDTFLQPENTEKGAISINGRMIERLHLDIARSQLERSRRLAQRI